MRDGSQGSRSPLPVAGRRTLGALVLCLLASAALAPSASAGLARSTPFGLRIHRPAGGAVSLTPSRTRPHWACPNSPCEAIVDPPPVKVDGHYRLPDGTRLEGGGVDGGLDPADLQSAYKIPTSVEATPTVAVIGLGGYSGAEKDLAKYREKYGLPACTKADGCFHKINYKGEEANFEANESEWEEENALDLDMVSAACPTCHLMLAEGDLQGEHEGFGFPITAAISLGATIVSNSWGELGNEEEAFLQSTEAKEITAASEHSTFLVAAGDFGYEEEGSGDPGEGWPESLPDAFSVGGTALTHASNARGWSERPWDEPGLEGETEPSSIGTNSGCSPLQPKPPWQKDTGCAHRMENDLAAVAACATPVSFFQGQWGVICGTSASAPLVAGILAHAGWGVRSLGVQALYERPSTLFDVTEGTDAVEKGEPCAPPLVSVADEYFCDAEVGYDGPTGLGTPDGVPGAGVLAPSVAKIEPDEGPAAGGTKVTISGADFEEVSAVKFGSTNATSYTVESPQTITAFAPAASGSVAVSVTSSEGASPPTAADEFAYSGAPGAPCSADSGTITLAPGLTSTAKPQTVKIKGTFSGCAGRPFSQVEYKATLKTTAAVSCSVLTGAGEAAAGPGKYKWTPKAKPSAGTLTVQLTETSAAALSAEVASGPYSPLTLAGKLTEAFAGGATCGQAVGKKAAKPVKKGTFSA